MEGEAILKLKADISDVQSKLRELSRNIGEIGDKPVIEPDPKTIGYLETLEKKLNDLRAAQTKALTQDEAKKYNAEIIKTQKAIDGVRGATEKAGQSITRIGGYIAAAFSVRAIINFTTEMWKLQDALEAIDIKAQAVFKDTFPSLQKEADKTANTLGMTTHEYKAATTQIVLLAQNMGISQTRAREMSRELLKVAQSLALTDKEGRKANEIAVNLTKALAGQTRGLVEFGFKIGQTEEDTADLTDETKTLERAYFNYNEVLKQAQILQSGLNTEMAESEKLEQQQEARLGELQNRIAELSAPMKEIWLQAKIDVLEFADATSDAIAELLIGQMLLYEQMGIVSDDWRKRSKEAKKEISELGAAAREFSSVIAESLKAPKPKKKSGESDKNSEVEKGATKDKQGKFQGGFTDTDLSLKELDLPEAGLERIESVEEVLAKIELLGLQRTQEINDLKLQSYQQLSEGAVSAIMEIANAMGASEEAVFLIQKAGAIANAYLNFAKAQSALSVAQAEAAVVAASKNPITAAYGASLLAALTVQKNANRVALGLNLAMIGAQSVSGFKELRANKEGDVRRAAEGDPWVTGGQEGVDSVPYLLMPRERVVTAKMNQKHFDALQSIHEDRFDSFIVANHVAPALAEYVARERQEEQKTFAENIANSLLMQNSFNDYNIVTELRDTRKQARRQHDETISALKISTYQNKRRK